MQRKWIGRLHSKLLVSVLWLFVVVYLSPVRAATVEYIHTDALGSPVVVTNSAGQVIERRGYEPYGLQLVPATLSNGPGFTGHVADVLTGLNYMQQRYYDPMIGRFLSVDPVTAYTSPGANFNRYWYANNNPYRFTDPDGRQALDHSAKFLDLNRRHGGDVDSMNEEMSEGLATGAGIAGGVALLFAPDPTDALLFGVFARMAASRVPLAYKVAAEGGRHAGQLKQYLKQTPSQLQRTIRSLDKRIAEHREKIKNPEKYMSRDDASVPANVERAKLDWTRDINRQQEHKDIAKQVLRQMTTCTGTRIKGNC